MLAAPVVKLGVNVDDRGMVGTSACMTIQFG
jgi:hypothetical protein